MQQLKSVRLIVDGTLLAIFTGITLGACSQSDAIKEDSVIVDKSVPLVKVKAFYPNREKSRSEAAKSASMRRDVDAYTQWFFSCKADFETEEVFADDTTGAASIALKIKRVRLKLALPIIENIPPDASSALRQHEDGHVKICSLVYAQADQAAVAAARMVLGQTFNGMGKNLKEARSMAVAQAQGIIAQGFRSGTGDLVDKISKQYDMVCEDNADRPEVSCLRLAQSAYDAQAKSSVKILE